MTVSNLIGTDKRYTIEITESNFITYKLINSLIRKYQSCILQCGILSALFTVILTYL